MLHSIAMMTPTVGLENNYNSFMQLAERWSCERQWQGGRTLRSAGRWAQLPISAPCSDSTSCDSRSRRERESGLLVAVTSLLVPTTTLDDKHLFLVLQMSQLVQETTTSPSKLAIFF